MVQAKAEDIQLEQERTIAANQAKLELADHEKINSTFQVDQLDVLQAVSEWANHWSEKDVNAYLSHYSDDFTPAKQMPKSEWKVQRIYTINNAQNIDVEVNDPNVEFLGSEHAQVVFKQIYRTDNYSDQVTKTLLMKNINGNWLIAEEMSN